MRILSTLITIAITGYGFWWISTHHPEMKTKIENILDSGQFHTLELNYSANQIMETHRKRLLKDSRHKYLEPELRFHPYVLMEVKYTTEDNETREGVMLWDLLDGEIVTNTKEWEKTHGFGDCINADAQAHEFKILNVLARKGGAIDREGLSNTLHLDNEILDAWIDSCRRKKLIVQSGNQYRLHLQNPKFQTVPETKINQWLVTKPYKDAVCVPKRYSLSQIQKIARAAFGNDFAIRKTTDVYLPVHNIIVQNPDGSIKTTMWNALNGKNLSPNHFIQ